PGNQHRGPDNPPPPELFVDQDGDPKSQHQFQEDGDHRKDRRVGEGVPQPGAVGKLQIIFETDKVGLDDGFPPAVHQSEKIALFLLLSDSISLFAAWIFASYCPISRASTSSTLAYFSCTEPGWTLFSNSFTSSRRS